MRTYLSYKNDGEMWGVVKNDRAWPQGYDITSVNPSHPLAIRNRVDHFEADADLAGFVAYDCACADDSLCNCGAQAIFTHYVNNGVMIAKPALILKVDGVVQAPNTVDNPLPIAPGTTFTLTIETAVPDGTTVQLPLLMSRMAVATPTLSFTNGIASCQLKAPAQGSTGLVGLKRSRLIRPFTLFVLGWE